MYKINWPIKSLRFIPLLKQSKKFSTMWALELLFEYRTGPSWVMIAIFASICSGLLPLLFSYYFGRILDILSTNVETQDSAALNLNCGMCLVSGILCILTTWLSQFCFQLAAETTCNEWKASIIRHAVRQDLSYFVRFPPAAINSALVDESQKMLMGMGQKMAMTLEFLSCFCGSVVISFCRSPLLSAVMIAISPMLLASGGILSNHVERITEQHTAQLSKLAEVAGDYLSNLRLIKVLNAEQLILKLFQDFATASSSNAVRRGLIIGSLIGMVDFCVFCSYSVGMWYGGKLIVDARIDNFTGLPTTGGDVICVFNSLVWGFYGLGQAMGSWTFLQAAAAALQTFYDCVNAGKPSAMNVLDHSKPQRTLTSHIEFRSVSFKYEENGQSILDDVSFKINKGEMVAICGESGCGKSTLQSMLLRLWKPTKGSINVDGFDLNDFSAYDFDAMVACVCQEPGLFVISVVDNLTCMNENIPFKEVVQTCKLLGLHDLIQQMPKKYDTILDPAKLSGGQKQRFALVRAMVRKTPVIIMDEPFSALDNENEKIVYNILEELSLAEKVTIIFVTHRLINMKASNVVMMKNGGIDQIGSIDSLVLEGGYFSKLLAANVGPASVASTHNSLITIDAPNISSIDAVKRRSSIIKSGYLGRMFASTLTIPDAPIGGYVFDNMDDEDSTTSLESLWSLFQQFGSDQKASVLIGFLAAIMNGLSFPLFSVIIGSTLNVMLQNDKQVISDSLPRASLVFFGLGVFSLIINVLQKFCCSLVAENFGNKLRFALFSQYLSVQLEMMDSNSRNVMIDDMVQGIEIIKVSVTDKIAMYTQILILGVTSLVISLLFGWQLTLALIVLTPIAFVANWIDSRFVNQISNECMEMNHICNEMSSQITQNLITILTIPNKGFVAKYEELLAAKTVIARKRIFFSSLSLALSNAVQFVIYASSLWLGCWFVRIGLCEKEAVLNVFMILSIAGMGITQLFQNTSDALFLNQYVAHIKKRLDDGNRFEITIDDDASEHGNQQSVGTNKSDDEANSGIQFTNVVMKYKSARAAVLNKINFTIAANSVTAFVGESGCGKSSIVSALLRLYDISDGQIYLGGTKISEQPAARVRDQIAIVQQESSLFDESILLNFQIAVPSCTETQIWESLETSGAKEFVELLPEKLRFKVGHNGSKLSGGQKQRISISISILQLSTKNVLILDEASSALDAFAEKALLDCIQTFRGKKTIIIIAHTPALLNVCDAVILVKNGKVVESSTAGAVT
jgi:ATP-binding cassette subfamily B (MDR/TAP) protein 1